MKTVKPQEIKKGNSIVTLYTYAYEGYSQFKIAYYHQGKRKLESFSTEEKARTRADEINDSVNQGNAETLTLTRAERYEYTQALEILRPSGEQLFSAVRTYAEAQKILGSGALLVKAAAEYAERYKGIEGKTVRQAAEEFIKEKEADGNCSQYVCHLRGFFLGQTSVSRRRHPGLRNLSEVFCCPLLSITGRELCAFIDGLRGGAYTRNQKITFLREFFNWCKKKKYLPAIWSEHDSLKKRKIAATEIEILTPEELETLLYRIEDESLRTVFAICAFSGLRAAEATRLDWAQVGIDGGKFIEVKGRIAKTRQRRLVPLTDNLKAWLARSTKREGKVWPTSWPSYNGKRNYLLRKAKINWKPNCLRHSYISYRVAQTSDVAKVSLEAGNSPQVIFRHYRALVTPEGAEKWFSIMPPECAAAADKITYLKTASV